MINVAAICSIKNWPLTAQYGFSSLFYYLIGMLLFFIPCSLVSAELASAFPQKGGIYAWVREAMGPKMAFLAIWLLWLENVFYFPTVLSFVAATVAYAFNPAWLQNSTFTFIVVAGSFWISTLLNLRGIKTSGLISTVTVIIGTILPGVLIIGLGAAWYFGDSPLQINMSWNNLVPKLSSANDLSLLAGMLLGFAGIEMSAVHARDVQNPQKGYPRAILLSAAIIATLSVLGTLSIAIVIPRSEISLVASSMEAINLFMNNYGIGKWLPLVAILIGIGGFGTVSTWAVGPIRGLLAAADGGELPSLFHKVNKHGMPAFMMILQAVIVTIISMLFLYLPDINSSFWIMIVIASQLYIVMYGIMFICAIILRYKKPNTPRPYRIPFKNIGMWTTCIVGFVTIAFCFFIGFYPPSQVSIGSPLFYFWALAGSIILFCGAPFIILAFKKRSWAKS